MICGSTGKKLLAKAEDDLISSLTLPEDYQLILTSLRVRESVSRLMDIIINSLYSNKDIFLRELISNASDALDKLRFLSLTDEEVLGEGDNAKLEIQIKLDKEKKFLSIRDRGIGMMKEDLIKNLGTIAKSGTSAFGEKMQSSEDLNLIGQFGVGFYSVYLAADYVEVLSKHNEDKQYVWESKADGALAISEDTWNEPLGRGTEIRLHIRDEAGEYLEEKNFKRTAQVMYQAALMESGFMLNDPKDFSSRIYSSVKSSLSISPDAIIEEEDDVEEVETSTKEATSNTEAEPTRDDEDTEPSAVKDEL